MSSIPLCGASGGLVLVIVVLCSDQWHDLRTMAILGLGKICTVAPDQTNWPLSSYPAMCMDLFMWIWSNLCPPVDLLVRVCVCVWSKIVVCAAPL